ncbi:hypothetical protein [Neolewinella persica]|uniref:hypothetical protein n=1 Tax=Neolewinella persica TaxID=70998 RepID=UPI000477DBE2|nr:hypothetical protein [Neolewinella persica]
MVFKISLIFPSITPLKTKEPEKHFAENRPVGKLMVVHARYINRFLSVKGKGGGGAGAEAAEGSRVALTRLKPINVPSCIFFLRLTRTMLCKEKLRTDAESLQRIYPEFVGL